MDPSMLTDDELELLEFLYERMQLPLRNNPTHPIEDDCFQCQLEAKRPPLPVPPEGNPAYLDDIPDAISASVEPLVAKNLASMTTVRSGKWGMIPFPAVRLTAAGKQLHREYLRQKQQAQHEMRLRREQAQREMQVRGGVTNVFNIHDSHGFIAGSQRDFIQENCDDS
ncbi:hypothetical protein ACFZA1_42615 [Streptomyces filipinensis]|uniref:hypothetical protein n=1 Tax=Streptomyces filipinensis TaxID=66887 RepID=UPI0036E5AAD9